MKIPKPFILLAATFVAVLAFGGLAPAHARAQVSYGYFYDALDPYGEWVQVPDYGYVWHPTNVDDNWAPYTDGYWAYTDAGWTWVSYEDYGGIVYHYGRWTRIPGEGWVWVPGETWAPAWVSWRTSDDYVGWAPLPPEARWHVGVGFGGGVDVQFDIGPRFYSFVNVGDFGAPALGAVILDRQRNTTIINNTTNITNITNNNSTVYTGGPRYSVVAARSTRPIPTLKLVRQTDAGAIKAQGGKILARQQGSQLTVIAPHVTATAANASKPVPPKVARTLTGVKADTGWGGVDPAENAKLHEQFKTEAASAGKTAKPVNPADIKFVTDRAKAQGVAKTAGPAELPKALKSKAKTEPSEADLENAPAKESGQTATSEATPKPRKKRTAAEDGFLGTKGDEVAPTPRSKVRIPKDENTPGAETTPKRKRSEASDLQPFTSGDSRSEVRSEPKREASEKSYQGGGAEPDGAYGLVKSPKTAKSKKKKGEEEQSGNAIPSGQ